MAYPMQVRLTDEEAEAFKAAAALCGISLSAWVTERLRLAVIRELREVGQAVPFLERPAGS